MVFEYATRLSSLLSTTANENDGRGQYPSSVISAESTKDRRIRRPSLPIYSSSFLVKLQAILCVFRTPIVILLILFPKSAQILT